MKSLASRIGIESYSSRTELICGATLNGWVIRGVVGLFTETRHDTQTAYQTAYHAVFDDADQQIEEPLVMAKANLQIFSQLTVSI